MKIIENHDFHFLKMHKKSVIKRDGSSHVLIVLTVPQNLRLIREGRSNLH